MNQLDNIQNNLVELSQKLEKSFQVLDALQDIRDQFEELQNDYQQLKNYQQQAETKLKNIEDTEHKLVDFFQSLEPQINHKFRSLDDKLLQTEQKTEKILKKVELQKKVSEQDFKELNILKEDLRVTLQKLKELGFNPDNLNKLEKYEHYLNNSVSAMDLLEKKLEIMRNWIVMALLISALAVTIPIAMFIFQPYQKEIQSYPQERNEVENNNWELDT